MIPVSQIEVSSVKSSSKDEMRGVTGREFRSFQLPYKRNVNAAPEYKSLVIVPSGDYYSSSPSNPKQQ